MRVADNGGGDDDDDENAAAGAAPPVDDWAPRRAWFKLSLLHPSGDEGRASHKDATHTFVPTAVDWGFTNFLPLSDVRAEFIHPDGSIVVRCELSTDPSVVPPDVLPGAGALGGYFGNQNYDCRRETGHGKREEEEERERKREAFFRGKKKNSQTKKKTLSLSSQSASRTRAPPAT